jgi:CBS domain-containing protein
MQVETILQSKGREVTTITSRAPIRDAVDLLNRHRIGAVVVVDNGKVTGILSERDVVRHLGDDWNSLAQKPVAEVMTRNVITAAPASTVADLMERMTEHRIRHMPIVEGDTLVGIVSIGDVVKRKIEEAEQEASALKQYIAS